jgi:hypothetical protein
MDKLQQLKQEVKDLKTNWITNTIFICRNYKPSTFYRLKEGFSMSSDDIDSNKKIRQHILRYGLKNGFTQDKLFQAISK